MYFSKFLKLFFTINLHVKPIPIFRQNCFGNNICLISMRSSENLKEFFQQEKLSNTSSKIRLIFLLTKSITRGKDIPRSMCFHVWGKEFYFTFPQKLFPKLLIILFLPPPPTSSLEELFTPANSNLSKISFSTFLTFLLC